jgi:hypothetical protein
MSALAQLKAEKRRQQLIDTAVQRWKEAVKGMGLNGTALRSGLRSIEASSRPGNAVTNLIREYRGRKVQPVETSSLADLSDVQALKVKLYRRRRNAGWFPSDPQYLALARLEWEVVAGLAVLEFQKRARQIRAMAVPYKRWVLEDEKRGIGSFNEREPVRVRECPDHMKRIITRERN